MDNANENRIYNNIFNNVNNHCNVWMTPTKSGFSQTCRDDNRDGICDVVYGLFTNNIDYLPIAYGFSNETPPGNVTNLRNITYARNYIKWAWTEQRQ